MATRNWLGTVSSNMNDSSNYSGSGNLLTTDALIFDSTSSVDATATASLSVQSITVDSAYLGSFKDMGQSITISTTVTVFNTGASSGSFITSGNWSVTGSWTFGANGMVNMSGSAVSLVGTTLSTVTAAGKNFNNITCTKTATAGVTFSGDITLLGNFTVSDTNSQAISWSGAVLTTSGNITIGGTGIHNFGNGITMNGSGTICWIKSTIGNPTSANCDFILNGTNITFTTDKLITSSGWDIGISFRTVTLGVSASLTCTGQNFSLYFTNATPLILNNNSSLTLNMTLGLYFLAVGSYPFMSVGSNVTFNGTASVYFANWNVSVTCSIPAVTWTGSGYWIILLSSFGKTLNANLTGDINLGSAIFYCVGNVATSSGTVNFDSNDYNIDCGVMRFGETAGTLNAYFGNSTCTIASFDGQYWANGCNMYMESSTWYCSGDWYYRSNHVVTGTSKINIVNTSTITVNSGTNEFYDLEFNAPGKNIILSSSAIAAGLHCRDFLQTDGTFSQTTYGLYVLGNAIINNGALSWNGGGITMTGSDTTLSISENLLYVSVPTSGFQITTRSAISDNYGLSLKSLILLTDATIYNVGTKSTVYNSNTFPLTFTNRGTLTVNGDMTFVRTTAGAIFGITGSPTINGNAKLCYKNLSNISLSVPATTYSGNLSLNIDNSTGVNNAIWNLSGNLNFSNTNNFIVSNSGPGDASFFTQNYSISGYPNFFALKTYNTVRNNSLYFGTSSCQLSSWSESGSLGSFFYDNTAVFTIAGSFIGCADSTYRPEISLYNFTGDGILNCFDKTTFYDATVDAPNKTLVCTGNFNTSRNFALVQGNFDFSDCTAGILGNAYFDGTGILGLGSIKMAGASKNLHIGNTLADITASNSIIGMYDTTGQTLDVDKLISIKALYFGNSARATSSGDSTVILKGPASSLLELSNDATFTNNSGLEIHNYQTNNMISMGLGSLINGTAPYKIYLNAPSVIGNLSDVTYAGTGGWFFYDDVGYDSTIQFNGNINIGDNDLNMYLSGYPSARNKWLVHKDVSCGTLTVGRDNSTGGSFHTEYGKGTITLDTYKTPNLTGTELVQHFQHSTWNCLKDWTFGSGNSQMIHMTDVFNFNGPGNITSNGKPFNWVKINSDSTLADDMACHWIQKTGTLNENGKALRLIGDSHAISYVILA
jgi:hypothetical protein